MTEFGRPSSDTTASSVGTETSDTTQVHEEIRSLILQEHYPGVAAIQSVARKEHSMATYGQCGSGTHWQQLRSDLLEYVELQRALEDT